MPITRTMAQQTKEDTLEDKDGNTKIEVEQSDNEDTIRFITSGSERMVIQSDGIIIMSGSVRVAESGVFMLSGSQDFNIDADNELFVSAGGTLAYKVKTDGNVEFANVISFEDYIIADLSIPGLDLQNDTNAFRFNCPYNLIVEGLDLFLDQHTTSGNVTVTVANGANSMINLSIPGTDLTASTTTVSNASRNSGDVITFAITATTANAQGLRANMKFRRLI